jgi:chaperone required for assembly of F1-ATPase
VKRFYKAAAVEAVERGWQVTLDGRQVRTPARAPLILPTEVMAAAIAREWQDQGDLIDPAAMPFLGLANAAIDHVASARGAFAGGIAAYGESDLICYRAAEPEALVARQCKVWDPLLDWAKARYDIGFELADGIRHVTQPEPTLRALRAAIDAFDDFALAAAQPIVTITGSLVVTLALLEKEIDVETAWQSGQLEELYSLEQWGSDEEAEARHTRQRTRLETAAAFLDLR